MISLLLIKNPSQFAERLRELIEKNEDILNYPEVIAEFIKNNESVADFFENQMTNKQYSAVLGKN